MNRFCAILLGLTLALASLAARAQSHVVLSEVELFAIRAVAQQDATLLRDFSMDAANVLRNGSFAVFFLESDGHSQLRLHSGHAMKPWERMTSADYQELLDLLSHAGVRYRVESYRDELRNRAPKTRLESALRLYSPRELDEAAPFVGRDLARLPASERTEILDDPELGGQAHKMLSVYENYEAEKTATLLDRGGEERTRQELLPFEDLNIDFEPDEDPQRSAVYFASDTSAVSILSTGERGSPTVFRIDAPSETAPDLQLYVRFAADTTALRETVRFAQVHGQQPIEALLGRLILQEDPEIFYGLEGNPRLYHADTAKAASTEQEEAYGPPDH